MFKHRNSNDSKFSINRLLNRLKNTSDTTSCHINPETESNFNTISGLKSHAQSQKNSFSIKGDFQSIRPKPKEDGENHNFEEESEESKQFSTPKRLTAKTIPKDFSVMKLKKSNTLYSQSASNSRLSSNKWLRQNDSRGELKLDNEETTKIEMFIPPNETTDMSAFYISHTQEQIRNHKRPGDCENGRVEETKHKYGGVYSGWPCGSRDQPEEKSAKHNDSLLSSTGHNTSRHLTEKPALVNSNIYEGIFDGSDEFLNPNDNKLRTWQESSGLNIKDSNF